MLGAATLQRTASALRTALAGRPMTAFSSAIPLGPSPRPGRVIEYVEAHGRNLEIVWDDGVVLTTEGRHGNSWRLYRHGDRWREPHVEPVVTIAVADWIAVCAAADSLDSYRLEDRRRHPGMGRRGPDVGRGIDVEAVSGALLDPPDPNTRIAVAMLDERIVRGLGNVGRSEVLWAARLNPRGRIGDLDATLARRLAAAAVEFARDIATQPPGGVGLAVYGRTGQRCPRCRGTIDARTVGADARVLYWCGDCQTDLAGPHGDADDHTPVMDRHPAAARFLSDLPWNRDL